MNDVAVTVEPQSIPIAEKITELEDEHAELNQVSLTFQIAPMTI